LDRFAELGINGLFPFEVAAGSDVLAFRERHPRFFVWGAFDKRALLGTRDDVEREVMAKVPKLWEQGGFIPSIDHSVPPCPQENFEHFLELVRSICR
jgi:uroporphyrinogen decarboxylase